MDIAVITGASSGMGRDFALQLDRQKKYDEIWLISRSRDKLESLKAELNASARVLTLDLSDPKSTDEYAQMLERIKPNILTLVNAAGYGRFKAFEQDTLDEHLGMIDLNDRALTALTYRSLPYMKRGAGIYMLGSMSCWQPVPYMSVYAASKAFVLSFSRALNAELKGRGIRVMAVCPGWVKTDFFTRAKSDETISYFNRWVESPNVVRKALVDMEKGREVSILGFHENLQAFLVKHLPHSFVMKTWLKQQKH